MLAASFWSADKSDLLGRFVLTIFNGQTAVMLFFAISGAVLLRSMKATTVSDWALLPIRFTFRRVLRIYPALIGCLIGFYAIAAALNSWHPTEYPRFPLRAFFENASLHSITMHGASWTLQVEMLAIPFLLLTYALNRRFGIAALVGVFCYSIMVADNPTLSFGFYAASLWMPSFAAGMLAADVAKSKFIEDATRNGRWAAWLFVVLFLHMLTNPSALSPGFIRYVATFFVVAHIMSGARSALSKFLSLPISQYLGKISYSLYLWNVPFLYITRWTFVDHKYGDHYLLWGIASGSVITLLTIPVAHVSERYLERSYVWFSKITSISMRRRDVLGDGRTG